MTFAIFTALDNDNHILARCKTLADAKAVKGCVRTGMEFDEQPHRMYLDNSAQMWHELSMIEHAGKVYDTIYGVAPEDSLSLHLD